MIVTLTTNPSLDRTIALEAPLRVGEVQGALSAREDAGGKGINVARVVAAASRPTLAVLPLDPTDPFAGALDATGIDVHTVAHDGATRANVTIADAAGVTTKLNLPGAAFTAEDAAALTAAVVAASEGASWLVLAGSLAPGLPDDYYVQVIGAVRSAWGAAAPRIAVDTSGAALAAAVASGRPDLIKPNDEELAELVGRDVDAALALPDAVADIAAALVPASVGAALVTLGGDGAVLVTPDGSWHGTPPPTRVRSTVGAGDSSLAGYLLAETAGAEPEDRLRSGIRYGSAAASLPGTQPPTPDDLSTGDVPVRRLLQKDNPTTGGHRD
ncbi:1-phosphofructokinase [Microbacterium oleivorans]|uniref:1-phosphofructokinase n=1 Tax=Microbacterium oleivorans TaxID=273677 RepID=A0A031G057_9MICO|nr:1-phosphofructokinase [Microbacterium oleivorans]EZP29907.1 1-phosphofructokinase [Microbacterium oleivorans]THE07134.1 1-phosphofructokinase [Microbacterium oleivorans]